MKLRWWHFGYALAASVAIHAVADHMWRIERDVVLEQGTSTQFAVLGSAMDNMIMEGDVVEPEAADPPPVPQQAPTAATTIPASPSKVAEAAAVAEAEPVRAAMTPAATPGPLAAAPRWTAVAIPVSDTKAPIVAAAEVDRFEIAAPPARAIQSSRVDGQNNTEIAVEVAAVDLDSAVTQSVSPVAAAQAETSLAAATAEATDQQTAAPVPMPTPSPLRAAETPDDSGTAQRVEAKTAPAAPEKSSEQQADAVPADTADSRQLEAPADPIVAADAVDGRTGHLMDAVPTGTAEHSAAQTVVAKTASRATIEPLARPVEAARPSKFAENKPAQPARPIESEVTASERAERPEPVKTAALVRPIEPNQQRIKPKNTVKKKGDRGASSSTAKKGAATGRESGSGASAGSNDSRNTGAAGNARVSNYPGKVRRKLRRAIRYPKKGRASKIAGTTVVRFSVAGNGSLIGAQVLNGSGHAMLDSAAIAAVERAAPFPKIPPAANRSSWTFTVPVEFLP